MGRSRRSKVAGPIKKTMKDRKKTDAWDWRWQLEALRREVQTPKHGRKHGEVVSFFQIMQAALDGFGRFTCHCMVSSHYTRLSWVIWSKCSMPREAPSRNIRWSTTLSYLLEFASKMMHFQLKDSDAPNPPLSRVIPWFGQSQINK